ncbi:hypothetical protein [Mesorhizobium sp. CAU 1741]|uniref:hypothetical protein n=1 Tax=Mesorhizobium sp. CAU 1741 TaxID=3140366 RepID=UPI00325A5D18
MEKVTVEVTTLRPKAERAGTLGRWTLTAGGSVFCGASGLGLLYTRMTGSPPP